MASHSWQRKISQEILPCRRHEESATMQCHGEPHGLSFSPCPGPKVSSAMNMMGKFIFSIEKSLSHSLICSEDPWRRDLGGTMCKQEIDEYLDLTQHPCHCFKFRLPLLPNSVAWPTCSLIRPEYSFYLDWTRAARTQSIPFRSAIKKGFCWRGVGFSQSFGVAPSL